MSIRKDHADANAHAVFVALGNRSRGRGLSAQSVYNIVKARGGWHPHQLRHGAIEAVLRGSNNSLPLAQALAGHIDPASTMLYVGRAERRRLEAEAVELMGGLFWLAEFKLASEVRGC